VRAVNGIRSLARGLGVVSADTNASFITQSLVVS
jgi:hypothetical protein